MSHLYHQVILVHTWTRHTDLSFRWLPGFPTAVWLIHHMNSALINTFQSLHPSLWPTEPTYCWWQPAWSHGYEGNDAELYFLKVWPKRIKLPPETSFSFPLLERRCLRNVMISVTFTLLEVEDYPHHLIFPQYYYSLMLCFSRSCRPKYYPCGK